MMYQNFGRRFWVANAVQATAFTVAHGSAGSPLHFASALWEGWIVRRNDWSIRESVFRHFWYDDAIITATRGIKVRTHRLLVARLAPPVLDPQHGSDALGDAGLLVRRLDP